MKRVLIISPYFPPTNAADMQRVRMSLPFFKEFGWEAEIVTVAEKHSFLTKDPLLLQTLPENLIIHKIGAFPVKWTSKFGLGSIALRSLFFYKRKVDALLRKKKYDLIYFSTTQFPVCILGAGWKKKFNIPYVIDMQDPWHTEFYRSKPSNERPKKYLFSYYLNKNLEPRAIKNVDGLISVSDAYIKTLKLRYPEIRQVPEAVITFGASEKDQEIVGKSGLDFHPSISRKEGTYSLVYVGRGGNDMHKALSLLFQAFCKGLAEEPSLFTKFRMHFIGTSYAPAGEGRPSILPLALQFGLKDFVSEDTNRVPFYQGLATLNAAGGLLVPGSEDAGYTASKIYPYILTRKPIFAIFHKQSSIVSLFRECHTGNLITLDSNSETTYSTLKQFLVNVVEGKGPDTDWVKFDSYSAKAMTQRQTELFNQVLICRQ